MTIAEKIAQLKQVTEQQQDAGLLKIIDNNKAIVLDLNTGQLFSGKRSDGDAVKPPYKNERYAQFKRILNPRGVVDLKLTGDFYNSFILKDDRFPVNVAATDEKTGELVAKYGEQIFGLTVESKAELNQQIREEIIDFYRHEVYRV